MFKLNNITKVLLISLVVLVVVKADDDLSKALQDLRSAVPENALVTITASHYSNDIQFRVALDFLKTAEFGAIIAKIENSAAYNSVKNIFIKHKVPKDAIPSFVKLFDTLLVDSVNQIAPKPAGTGTDGTGASGTGTSGTGTAGTGTAGTGTSGTDGTGTSATDPKGRSLNNYAIEVMHKIPRRKFSNKVFQLMSSNENFRNFYTVIRGKEYYRAILAAYASPEIRAEILYLRNRYIDLRQLALNIITIFQWGPEVYIDE